jgi:hypothetical protein
MQGRLVAGAQTGRRRGCRQKMGRAEGGGRQRVPNLGGGIPFASDCGRGAPPGCQGHAAGLGPGPTALRLLTPTTGPARRGAPGEPSSGDQRSTPGPVAAGRSAGDDYAGAAVACRGERGSAVRAKDELSRRDKALLEGSYDCVDRVALNAYSSPATLRAGSGPGGGSGTRARTPSSTTPTWSARPGASRGACVPGGRPTASPLSTAGPANGSI